MPFRLRLRFRLATLMIVVAIAGVAVAAWSQAARRREVARFRRALDAREAVGIVTTADNDRIAFELGSDDGLAKGQELYLVRLVRDGPGPEPDFGTATARYCYLGRARVVTVGSQHAEARLVASESALTVREGDWAFTAGDRPRIPWKCGGVRD